jgi:hypothetical protein
VIQASKIKATTKVLIFKVFHIQVAEVTDASTPK